MSLRISSVLVAVLLAVLLAVVPSRPTAAEVQTPRASCTSQVTALSLQLGQEIALPQQYNNPTNERVTFIVTMRANSLFGPAHEVTRATLPARTGRTSGGVHLTGLRTPLGSARVVLDVTTDRTGAQIVGRCNYRVKLQPPPGVVGKVPPLSNVPRRQLTPQSLSWLYQVPVRMCVLEGSALAAGRKAGEMMTGDQSKIILDLLESVNTDIWFPNAQIAFSSAIETGFPVVADPTPPGSQYCGSTGDLEVDGIGYGDALFAEDSCAAAWRQRYRNTTGIPIVFARSFCDSGDIRGGSPGPDPKLYVKSHKAFGQRGDDLCGAPRRLTTADLTGQNRRPFVVLTEPARHPSARNRLAHELGHNFYLGHGNGLDDNRDGLPAGRPGPRRYDEICDPGWLVPPQNTVLAEDRSAVFTDCENTGSLMQQSALCSNLQPLQVETARSVARLMPGFVDATPRPMLTQ
jgi:hypothetical protein